SADTDQPRQHDSVRRGNSCCGYPLSSGSTNFSTMPQRKSDRRSKPRRFEYLLIECVTPELDAGRYPVKRIVGDVVHVGADIIKEGHDLVAAHVLFQGPDDDEWLSAPLVLDFDTDRWTGSFPVTQIGRWRFTVEAWTDRFGTWRSDLKKKVAAGQDVQLEL